MDLDLEGIVAQVLLVAAEQLAIAHPHRCWIWLIAVTSHHALLHYIDPAVSLMAAPHVPLPDDALRWN